MDHLPTTDLQGLKLGMLTAHLLARGYTLADPSPFKGDMAERAAATEGRLIAVLLHGPREVAVAGLTLMGEDSVGVEATAYGFQLMQRDLPDLIKSTAWPTGINLEAFNDADARALDKLIAALLRYADPESWEAVRTATADRWVGKPYHEDGHTLADTALGILKDGADLSPTFLHLVHTALGLTDAPLLPLPKPSPKEAFEKLREATGAALNGVRPEDLRDDAPLTHEFKESDLARAAQAAHEVNRVWSLTHGDFSHRTWLDAPSWQRESAVNGVRHVLTALQQGRTPRPEESHESWYAEKEAAGWVYGEVKDPDAKTHPCMVPYDQLSYVQRAKDALFNSTVTAFLRALAGETVQPRSTVQGAIESAIHHMSAAGDALKIIAPGAPTEHARTTAPLLVLAEVAAERERQVTQEGWTPEHDDAHAQGEMAAAAAAYALAAVSGYGAHTLAEEDNIAMSLDELSRHAWPEGWSGSWFKPTTHRRNLIKALALLTAEVERLDRAEQA